MLVLVLVLVLLLMLKSNMIYFTERYMANILASGYKDVFLPSVYDALLLTRPTCDFRDGRLITSSNFTQYLIELAFNDSYLFAMMHLIPADYTETLDCLSRSIAKHDVILPLVNNWNRHFLTSTTECLANSFISTL